MAGSKKSADKSAAAETLSKVADEETAPAQKYVLRRLSAELYAEAGDLTKAVDSVREILAAYAASEFEVLLPVLALAQRATKDPETAEQVLELASDTAETAIQQFQFQEALALLNVGNNAMSGPRTRRLQSLVQTEQRRVEKLAQDWDKLQSAVERMEKDAATVEDRESLGRFYCFRMGNWERGLPLLAGGSEETLAETAGNELKSSDHPADWVRLGESWEKTAKSLSDEEHGAAIARAATWYGRAVAELTGIEKISVEKRLQALPSPNHQLRLVAGAFRGTIRLEVLPDKLVWDAGRDSVLPKTARVNDLDWNVASKGELRTRGVFRVIPPDVSLYTARLHIPRPKITAKIVEVTQSRLVLELVSDRELKGDSEIVVRFGK